MNRPILTCLFVALAVCHSEFQVAAQDDRLPIESKPKASIAETSKMGIYDVYFPGGTMDEYVKLIRAIPVGESGESPLSVVVAENARSFKLPEIQIRANFESALTIVESCATGTEYVSVEVTGTNGEIFVIRLERDEPVNVEVINAKLILANMEEAAFLSAVEIGLEMHDSGEGVTIKLHHETGLLFVKGPSSATHLVHQVVSELGRDLGPPIPVIGFPGMGGGGIGGGGFGGSGPMSGGGTVGGRPAGGGGKFSGGGETPVPSSSHQVPK